MRAISIWVASLCVLILAMVSVGGITRLTGSGLSIVDWNPIMGVIPPVTHAQWLDAFHRYQLFPQYKLLNSSMTLGQFKLIFFWEYLHRLLGRLIGVALFVPWLGFLLAGRLDRRLTLKLLAAFVLGGLQGLLGWVMVKSGLVDQPYVSHLRLAAHLSLALTVLAYLFWIFLDLVEGRASAEDTAQAANSARLAESPGVRRALRAFTALVCLQIVYGAFTAGLHAGFGYNTFPKMMGRWLPPEAWRLEPAWLNAVQNPAMVQFIHRCLGWSVLAGALAWLVFALAGRLPRALRAPSIVLGLAVCVQFCLGVATLLLVVPVPIAALHQLGGCCVLLACIWANHRLAPAGIRQRQAERQPAAVLATVPGNLATGSR